VHIYSKGRDQMRVPIKSMLTGLGVSLLLCAVVGAASAGRLSVSNQNIRATWSSLEFAIGGVQRCSLTLEGSFHARTNSKVERSLVGLVTRFIFGRTSGGESCSVRAFNGVDRYNGTTTPNTLPWHLTYESFQGSLPLIGSVRVLLSRFRFGVEIPSCVFQVGNETDKIAFEIFLEAGRGATSITPVEGRNEVGTVIRLDRDPFRICPPLGFRSGIRFAGTGSITLLGAATRITITLI